jgi:hypothetical protein
LSRLVGKTTLRNPVQPSKNTRLGLPGLQRCRGISEYLLSDVFGILDCS